MARLVTTLLAATAIYLAIRLDFTLPQTLLRVTAAAAALLQLAALIAIAAETRLTPFRQLTILLSVTAVVACVWAWMPLSSDAPARSSAALAGISLALLATRGLVPSLKRTPFAPPWLESIHSVIPILCAAWAGAATAILAFEITPALQPQPIHLHPAWVLSTLTLFLAAAAACVRLSLRESPTDPLRLPPRLRGAYVYAAELLLAAAFAHLRLTMPWLFGGFFAQYWPLVVMAVAFAGVALGEILRRKRLPVVSGPLTTTGLFLPLLPALAFSLAPSRVDYAAVLILIAFFYAVLSAARHSFLLGLTAALAANGGLWSLLYRHPDLRFAAHPQLWLIPAAASVLAAAQLNHRRLTAAQLRSVRYACLIVVYVSSTADVFLNGVRDHPYLPLVLALLSVLGVLCGILFHVRAFLFLGASFLAVSIITMIYFASANLHWTWIWYVAGILLGAGIITLFALFEKKRTQMISLVEGLKSWQ